MIYSRPVELYFYPEKQYVAGQLLGLTDEMATERMHRVWWAHTDLKSNFDPPPIDHNWEWTDLGIEYEGRFLKSERIAIVAGDDDAVQCAMLVSTEPVASVLNSGEMGLFVERLFTAPWNRPKLRKDGQPYLVGVGTELITWAAWLSDKLGFRGRLLLDGSPDELAWYLKRGLQTLDMKPTLYEGILYTPMELVPEAATRLLQKWDAR